MHVRTHKLGCEIAIFYPQKICGIIFVNMFIPSYVSILLIANLYLFFILETQLLLLRIMRALGIWFLGTHYR